MKLTLQEDASKFTRSAFGMSLLRALSERLRFMTANYQLHGRS